jgi:hypothetical protein
MMTGDCALCGRGTVKVSAEVVGSLLHVIGECHGKRQVRVTGNSECGPAEEQAQSLVARWQSFFVPCEDEQMFKIAREVQRVEVDDSALSIVVHLSKNEFVEVSEFAIEQARERLRRRPAPLSKEQLAEGVAKLKASMGRRL